MNNITLKGEYKLVVRDQSITLSRDEALSLYEKLKQELGMDYNPCRYPWQPVTTPDPRTTPWWEITPYVTDKTWKLPTTICTNHTKPSA